MAGGKGTRIASIARDIPKPMIPVCGKPILEHQINCLVKNGITSITIVTGHLEDHITEYFGNGSRFGCDIEYYSEKEPLGTAGALYKIKNKSSDFILLNGDLIFDIDLTRMIEFHKEKNAQVTIAAHPNSHPYDSALVICDKNNRVTKWLNKEDERLYYKNLVNSGIHIISSDFIDKCPQEKEKVDLDRDMLKPSIKSNYNNSNSKSKSGGIFAYSTPEYIKDIGTPDRLAQAEKDMEKGIINAKNLSVRQKAVFLDRDGTINKNNNFVSKPEDMELIDGAAEAVKKINSLGYLAIVITNQPVIARGEVDFDTLDTIHMKMETELGKYGAYIDDLFYCPHHPDNGYEGERAEYKIICECRKPKPGMILEAASKYNIDLSKSYMAGDHERDVQAGINAGCIPVFLTNNKNDISYNVKKYPVLKDFADDICSSLN